MKCPGQDTQYWKSDAIYDTKCPKCEADVEFFKDDTIRQCLKCGYRLLNPSMDFGCASYCAHAIECIGGLPSELLVQKENLLKDCIVIEMKRYFGIDFKCISHAIRVAQYAEHIGKIETNSNMLVILSAGYLHDIGRYEAKKKYNSTAVEYIEIEGPPIARAILEKLNTSPELINEICDIIGHQNNPRDEESINYKILYDADLIATIEDNYQDMPTSFEHIEIIIKRSFMTNSGKDYARKILLK